MNEYSIPPDGIGYNKIRGRTEKSSVIADRANTKIIIVDGQSEHATANGTGAYTTVSANVHNFNIYDGGIYDCIDPLLGQSSAPSVGTSSVAARIGDRIIAQGGATRVIMVPIAMGGTPWAIYQPTATGSLFTRVQAAILRLRALGLAPDAIMVARGTTDNGAGTTQASAKASMLAWVNGVRALGVTCPIYLGKFTYAGVALGNSTAIRAAVDEVVATAGLNVLAGYDGDSNLLLANGYRLADTIHLSETGLTRSANGWADLILGIPAVVPGSTTFDTGSGNYTVPNYNILTIEVWGQGGGAVGKPGANNNQGTETEGTDGAASTVTGTGIAITANGGGRGRSGANGGTGGTAGTASGGNTTNTTGNVGGNRTPTTGTGNNTVKTSGVGGAAPNGGAQAAGVNSSSDSTTIGTIVTNGTNGNAPGGGGSGIADTTTGGLPLATNKQGFAGAGSCGYSKSVFVIGVTANAPSVGALLAYLAATSGGVAGGAGARPGGAGAAGRVKFTIE